MTKGGNTNLETDSDSIVMASNTSRNDDAAAVPHYMEPKNKNEIPSFLAILHLVTALFQCVQAIFLFAYSSNDDLRWMIFTNFPVAVDQNFREMEGLTDTGSIYYARPESKYIGGFGVPWMVGAFVLLSAADHMICVVPGLRKYYEFYLARNQSPFRWAEYSLSMPLMKMHISQLAGVTDVHMLFLVFMLSHVAIYFIVLHEHLNARARADGFRQNWLPFFMGTVPFLSCWSLVFCYYSETVARGDQPPEFVLPTMISLFCVELLFPVVFVLQWKKIGMFDDYMKGEFGFICLSFIAKSILAWATLVGAQSFVDNWS
eukprot:scaffold3359_cov123-Cylindrotheca_fusiformis.AAC.5